MSINILTVSGCASSTRVVYTCPSGKRAKVRILYASRGTSTGYIYVNNYKVAELPQAGTNIDVRLGNTGEILLDEGNKISVSQATVTLNIIEEDK